MRAALVGVVSVLAGTTAEAAGEVTVLLTRSGAETVWRAYASGEPIDDLPALDDSYQMVRVFADAADVIGPITLGGNRTTNLDLLIAGESVTSMPSATDPLARAGAGLAGVSAGTMAEHVRLAAAVETVSGGVEVGLVRRLEADVVGAAITARGQGTADQPALDGVTVGRRVAAAITATAGSIGSVRIGQGLEGDGLYAPLESTTGTIGSVEVCGEIVIAGPAGIRARDGIGLVRCTSMDESGWGAINAVIDANTGQHGAAAFPRLGVLRTLECDTLSGLVRARSLDDGLSGFQRRAVRAGMVFAPIEVTDSVLGQVEVAGFEPPGRLWVGESMVASIRADRGITSLEVGRSIDELFRCVPVEITCPAGAIGELVVHGQLMANSACDGGVVRVQARDGIGLVKVEGDAACNLECGVPGARAPLGRVVVGGSWYDGAIEASTVESLDVYGIFEGAVHLDELPVDAVVRTGLDRGGGVLIHRPFGLHGLVISNALMEGPSVWTGGGAIAREGAGWRQWTGPDCPFTGELLGGGMVGVAPFALRPIDCVPSSCAACLVGAIEQDELEANGVLLRFSGPVRKVSDNARALYLFPATSAGEPVPGEQAWSAPVSVTQVDARTLRVGIPGGLPAGEWVLLSGSGTLLCDKLMTAAVHEVTPFTFGFRVRGCGGGDYNRDGDIGTDHDIEAFFACLGGSCCPLCAGADFNGDGDIGTEGDIEAFFRVLGGGGC